MGLDGLRWLTGWEYHMPKFRVATHAYYGRQYRMWPISARNTGCTGGDKPLSSESPSLEYLLWYLGAGSYYLFLLFFLDQSCFERCDIWWTAVISVMGLGSRLKYSISKQVKLILISWIVRYNRGILYYHGVANRRVRESSCGTEIITGSASAEYFKVRYFEDFNSDRLYMN